MGRRVGVPLIDMEEADGLAEKLVKACEGGGCFRVTNHGVPAEILSEMRAVTAAIFNLPEEIRKGVQKPETTKSYNAYTPLFESTGVYDVTEPGATEEYCDQLGVSPHQKEVVLKYISALQDLATRIGRKLKEGLGLDGELYDGWSCTLRMNKYNYTPETVGSTGVVMHSDAGFLTILQDDDNVNGLEIVDEATGELVSVDPIPGKSTIVINCGDAAKVWSNGRFNNVKHQVMCYSPNVRYTLGIFVLAPKEAKLEAPSKLVDAKHPQRYVPFEYNEYRDLRISSMKPCGEALESFSAVRT